MVSKVKKLIIVQMSKRHLWIINATYHPCCWHLYPAQWHMFWEPQLIYLLHISFVRRKICRNYIFKEDYQRGKGTYHRAHVEVREQLFSLFTFTDILDITIRPLVLHNEQLYPLSHLVNPVETILDLSLYSQNLAYVYIHDRP